MTIVSTKSTNTESVLAGKVSICGLLFVALLCARRACHCQTGITIETRVQTWLYMHNTCLWVSCPRRAKVAARQCRESLLECACVRMCICANCDLPVYWVYRFYQEPASAVPVCHCRDILSDSDRPARQCECNRKGAGAPELLPVCLVLCTTEGSPRYTVEKGPIRQKAATVGRTNYTGQWPFCLPKQTNIQMSRLMTELKRHTPVDLNG